MSLQPVHVYALRISEECLWASGVMVTLADQPMSFDIAYIYHLDDKCKSDP